MTAASAAVAGSGAAALRDLLHCRFRRKNERLGVAGRLPDEVRQGGAAANETVARLVLDGALEIDQGGVFVSGPAAHGAVFSPSDRGPAAGRLAELSLSAIRYGQALAINEVAVLSRRLYLFGAIPRGPRWDRLVGAADEVTDLLGLGPGGSARGALAGDYQAMTHQSWLSWSRIPAGTKDAPQLPYKLYLSPRPEATGQAFRAAAPVLAEHGVWSFKVGRGVLGLLRPDKIVVYLEGRDQLDGLAAALATTLAGCVAQGVPFTAEASGDGLLSWGMDPPASERGRARQPRDSWRSWVTTRVADALVRAQSVATGIEPWEFALDRLGLDGVDTATWSPAAAIWDGSQPA